MNPKKKCLAILIPAHNEEIVIAQTLQSLLRVSPSLDIYLVDDCSSDQTVKVAQKYIKNIYVLQKNSGKAQALNQGIKHFNLTSYKFILPIDADTQITPSFVDRALAAFETDKKDKIVAVVGKIVGSDQSWVTSYRLWEYEIGQAIHKKAQDKEGAVLVCSGCTTVFRTKIFKELQFSSDTLTEDMDLAFEIHRQRLGKIVYCPNAQAITQDPLTLKDFIKQIERWYTGYWQCLYKHRVPFGKQMLDFEVTLTSIESLLGTLLTFIFIILMPWLITYNPFLPLSGLALDILLIFLPTLLVVSIIPLFL